MSAIWAVKGLHVRFEGRRWPVATPPHDAVRGVDIEVHAGERVGLIGQSGSGKTTFARAALGLVPHTSGAVHLFGDDTSTWTASRWRRCRGRVQLLFQDPAAMLNPAMRIGALLEESARLHRPDDPPRAAVHDALECVGLADRHKAWPHELSGGERRRVGVARLLLARPALVVADEPTAGLDAALKADLIQTLLEHVGPSCAVVLISHDLPVVAWATQRMLVMKDGRIVDRFANTALHHPDRHATTRGLLRAAGMGASIP